MVFGKQPTTIKNVAHFGKTGADEHVAIIFGYEQGEIAKLQCAITAYTSSEAYDELFRSRLPKITRFYPVAE